MTESLLDNQAIVSARFGEMVEVRTAAGQALQCYTRQNLSEVVVGDVVSWHISPNDPQFGVIDELLPRKNLLSRSSARSKAKVKSQAVAANVDQVVIVMAVEPKNSWDDIDKYLALAECSSMRPVIVMNKIDLSNDTFSSEIEDFLSVYCSLQYQVLQTSALDGVGLKELQHTMAGKTNIVVGQSGVGKSSLIKQVLNDESIVTGELSQINLGKHTTTVSRLYSLPESGYLIDSPGVREIRLSHIEYNELFSAFPEFVPFIGACRFRNCQHVREPGCAILEGIQAGKIAQSRYDSFIQIANTLTK